MKLQYVKDSNGDGQLLGSDLPGLGSTVYVDHLGHCKVERVWRVAQTNHFVRLLMLDAPIEELRQDFKLDIQKRSAKFVLLKGLEQGNRFFSSYSEDEDPTKLLDGTVAYAIIGWANSVEEAQLHLYGRTY